MNETGKENSLAGRIVRQEEAEKRLRRVLEIGSGPVPISMISASLWCEWIVCSDFLEQNRQKIKQWLMTNTVVQPPGRHDETWLPFFKYVAQLERAEYFSFLFILFNPFIFFYTPSTLSSYSNLSSSLLTKENLIKI